MRCPGVAALIAAAMLTAACTGGGEASSGGSAPPARAPLAAGVACPVPARAGAGAGATLPDVRLDCLGGPGRISLRELPATPVVLNLWASWCGPCRAEMPALQRVHRAAGGRVLFLGIDTRDGQDAGRSFLQDFGVTYASLTDPAGTALNELGGRGLPLTVVLAADGRVLDRTLGGISQDKLAGVLERAGVRLDRAVLDGSG